jgi:hypothetical protein
MAQCQHQVVVGEPTKAISEPDVKGTLGASDLGPSKRSESSSRLQVQLKKKNQELLTNCFDKVYLSKKSFAICQQEFSFPSELIV